MFRFLLSVLILASNFLGVSQPIAEMGAGSGPGVMTMPIRGRARWAALALVLAPLLPAAANAQNAYITNHGSGTVSVINTATGTVTATIAVGSGPEAVAVTPDATKVYVTNGGSGTVSVIAAASNTVVGTIPVGGTPLGAAVTPDGAKVYVTNLGSDTVSVIATASDTVVGTIPVGFFPFGLAVTPDGTKVYFTDRTPPPTTGRVSVIDTTTNTVVATIPFVSQPFGVAVTPDGAKVYVTAGESGSTVSVIATASNSVIATIPVGSGPEGVAVRPDGTKVYVTNRVSGTVSVIDTATDAVTATIAVGNNPFGVAVTPDGTKVYVANFADNTVSVIAPATNTVAATIPVGSSPVAFGKFIGGPQPGSPPVAVNETKTTPDNTPVSIDLTAGATGNPTSAAQVGTPVGGTVTGFPGTTVTFTPTTGFSGAASFQFTLANAFGTSNTATATITVTPGPAPSISSVSPNPVTGSDSAQPFTINGANFVTGANVTLRDLMAVQTFANRVASSFSSTQIVINPVFTTAAHSWSVEVINPDGQSSGQFGFLVIAPPSLPPVAKDQDVTATAGVAKTIDLSKNATGGIPTGAKTSKPAHGTISATFGTSVIYTANACYTGPDSFTFRLTNAFGQSNLAKVTITVNPAGAPAIEVHLIDPYLLDAYHTNPGKIAEQSLFSVYNQLQFQANGLVADGVSAAIAVVKTNTCSGDVSVSTSSNGITLLPYDPQFLNLKNPPMPGAAILPIKAADLAANGGFAAVLVQAPIGAPAPSFTNLVVTAQQGSQTAQAQASLVPPPVVLVHGIWGDKTSLAGMASYLNDNIPLVGDLGLVQALCYSKYFKFDAIADPLSGGSDPCEQTSKDAIASTINGLLSTLDSLKIVGSRVDVVAHSMGGLAARWYASQKSYRSLRDRKQGQFHEIITLDTPELGSALAPFLDNHSTCKGLPFSSGSSVWQLFCSPLSIDVATVRSCFAIRGYPLAPPGADLTRGAVYSLYPAGPSLQNPKLLGPNIPGADWRAIGSDAPDNSNLEFLLNNLISAIYPSACAPGTAPTIDGILGVPFNDAIVTLPSQLDGIEADHAHRFQGLSHIGLPILLESGLSNANVPDSPDVWQLVACWLSRSGDSACLAGLPAGAARVSASKASPATKTAGLLASVTQVSASEASAANKSAVPMPHIVVAHPHSVDRLTLSVPPSLELGTPFGLTVNTGSDSLPELQAAQSSETGSSKAVPAAISRVAGQAVYLSVTPRFFGTTRFQVSAAYRDGGVASKEVAANVNLPSRPPAQFHADTFQVTAIRLDLDNPSLRLQPWAIYANIPGRVYLDARYVSYSIAPGVGPPVVGLDPNGVVHGLRTGTATIIGRFGALTDQVRVNVEAEQQ